MAIAQSKLKDGVTVYSRYRRTMGNTNMKEWAQSQITITSVLPCRTKARVRTSRGDGDVMTLALIARRYSGWSMYDPNEAILHKSATLDHVTRIERRKPCAKCKRRHAAEVCPPKVTVAP